MMFCVSLSHRQDALCVPEKEAQDVGVRQDEEEEEEVWGRAVHQRRRHGMMDPVRGRAMWQYGVS